MPDVSVRQLDPDDDLLNVEGADRPLPSRREILLAWLAGQPLVVSAVGLVAGILLDGVWAVPFVVAMLLFAAAGIVIPCVRESDGVRHLAVALAALAVGAMLHDLSFRRWPADHIVRYCGNEATPVRLTATVVTSPAIRRRQSGRITWFAQLPGSRFRVAAESIEGNAGDIPVSGTVAVAVREPVLYISAGDRVELFGRMYRPQPPANPGSPDYALINRRNGILVGLTCEHAANVMVQSKGSDHQHWLTWFRQRARVALLDHTFPGDVPGSRLLSTMVLGQRSVATPELNEAFIRTGTVHYLSVSGAHVGMIASVVWLIGMLVGCSRRVCAAWVIVLVTVYALTAETRPPILRASVMADLFCLSVLFRRPVRTANWLALSILILLPLKPTQLFNPGFQMSYITVIAIIYLCPQVHSAGSRMINWILRRDDPLLMPDMQNRLNATTMAKSRRWVAHVLGAWLAISLVGWMASVFLCTYHFGRFCLWGWLNSVLILPLVWFTLVLGLIKTFVSVVVPVAAAPLGWLLSIATDALIAVVNGLSTLPGSSVMPPKIGSGLLFVGLAVGCLWMTKRWLRVSSHGLAIASLTFTLLVTWRLAPAGPGDALRVHVMSVGSGITIVIQLPNGKTFLYDMGSFPPFDVERAVLGPLLARERIYGIDAVVLSHPNLDHFCGLPDLLHRRPVRAVLTTDYFKDFSRRRAAAGRLMGEVRHRQTPWQTLRRGDRLAGTGDVLVDVLWPPEDERQMPTANDSSVVLRITYAGRRILLCGDIEKFAQLRLIESADLKADVLVLPHHGSVNATTGEFLKAVDPEYCVRSSGQRDALTTNGLLECVAGRRYFNTADDGAVRIEVTPTALTVQPWLLRPS